MGNAVDISKNVADIILVGNNFSSLLLMLKKRNRLAKALALNVIIALSYNAVGIPLAILGILSGSLAMLIMILSLISVFANARLSMIYA
jgi:cation transport ATPase